MVVGGVDGCRKVDAQRRGVFFFRELSWEEVSSRLVMLRRPSLSGRGLWVLGS